MDIIKLRMQGFGADSNGIVCHRPEFRFAHERTAILKINVSKDTDAARAAVEAVIAAIDEPRCLVGRDRRGSVVLLFRADTDIGINTSKRELALRDGEQISILFGSQGQTLDPEAYQWAKSRSPYEVSRDSLPPAHGEFAEIAYRTARAAGAGHAEEFERERADAARRAEYATRPIPTAEERQDAEDEETVEAYKNRDIVPSDGLWALTVLAARRRWAARQKAKTEAA